MRDVGKEGGSVDDFDGDDEVSQGAVSYFNSESISFHVERGGY
jgi:hypothetical protein